MRLRAGRGLGDSIYLRPIAEHFLKTVPVEVRSNYPDVFIGSGCEIMPFRRDDKSCRAANYTNTMQDQEATQFEAMCKSAKAPRLAMRFEWQVQNRALVDDVRAKARGRPIVLVHGGRLPMQREDQWTEELMPKREAFVAVLEAMTGCYRVRIGNDQAAYPLPVDLDLNCRTSVADMIDMAWSGDGMVAQCSFAVPLAEAFDKPLLAIWSARGMTSTTEYLRWVTPQKVIGRNAPAVVFMDNNIDELIAAAQRFSAVEMAA